MNENNVKEDLKNSIFFRGTMDVGTFQYVRIIFLVISMLVCVVSAIICVFVWSAFFGGKDYLLVWVIMLPLFIVFCLICWILVFKNRKGYEKIYYELGLEGVSFITGFIFKRHNFIKYNDILDLKYDKGILYNDLRAGNILITTAEKVYVIANIEQPENVYNYILSCVDAYYKVIASQDELDEIDEEEQDVQEEFQQTEEQMVENVEEQMVEQQDVDKTPKSKSKKQK